jgi:hypothetical protein
MWLALLEMASGFQFYPVQSGGGETKLHPERPVPERLISGSSLKTTSG